MNIGMYREPAGMVERFEEEHDTFEVLLCESGRGIVQIGGETIPVGPGDMVCIPPHTLHRDSSLEPRINAVLHLPPSQYLAFPGYRVFHDGEHYFQNLFDLAYDAYLNRYPNAAALISALGEAMFQLLRSWGYGAAPPSGAVAQVQHAILDGFSDPHFDLAALVRSSGYNANYFRRLFKAAYGMPPLEYLNHVRIEHAKSQMRFYGRLFSVQELGRNVGFEDPAYFSRLFRRAEGCSPTQYLKKIGMQ